MPTALDTFVDGVDFYHADVINAIEKILVGPIIYNVKSYGAKGDNATTDTSAIQAAIDACAAATVPGGVVYFPPGTYLTDTLALKSKVYMVGAGSGASILKQTSDVGGHHTIIPATGTTDCGVYDLGFVGIGGVGGNTIGIAAGTNGPVTRIKVQRCTFTLYSGSGVQMGGLTTNIVSDFVIRDCSFYDNAVNVAQPIGIAITNAQRGLIDGCNIEKTSGDRVFNGANYGIDMEPNDDSNLILDITVSNCRIRNTQGGIQTLARLTAPNQTRHIVIQGCEIFACLGDGILAGQNGAKGTVISACNIHDNGRYGVRFYGNDSTLIGSRLVDNNQAGSASGHISVETGVLNTIIQGCRIGYVQFAGGAVPFVLEVGTADYTLITGCNVRSSAVVSVTLLGANSDVANCPGYSVPRLDTNTHRFRYEPLGTNGVNPINVGTGATAPFAGGRGQTMTTGVTNPSSCSQRIVITPSGTLLTLVNKLRRFEVSGYLADTYANSNSFWYITDESVDTIPIATFRHIGIKNLVGVVTFTTADGTTEQTTDISASVLAATETAFVITFDGVTARCFVNGTLKATHATNVPTGGANSAVFRAFINNNATANSRVMAFLSAEALFANS